MPNPVLDKLGLTYLWSKIVAKLDTKVDKVTGKGLSANDFTADYKTKVDNAMPKSGGTFTGAVNFSDEVTGICFTGNWLQTTGTNNLSTKPDKIAVLDSSGIIRYRTLTQLATDIDVGSGNDGFEACTTTFSTNSSGDKVITQTFSDRTLVSTISTLSDGNKQIVEALTKGETTKTKTIVIDKTTGTITETVS